MYVAVDQYDLFYKGSCIVEALREYILSVICTAIVCGVLQILVPNGTSATLSKMISGLVITISVLSPVMNDHIIDWDNQFDHIISDSIFAVSAGENVASDLLKERIIKDTETYILTKASELGANLSAKVDLSSEYPNQPIAVTMKGNISPYLKKQLTANIVTELGIPEEKQIWII